MTRHGMQPAAVQASPGKNGYPTPPPIVGPKGGAGNSGAARYPFDFNLEAFVASEAEKEVDRAVRDTIAFIHSAAEAASRDLIIEHLRSLGYTITEPTP